MSKPFRKDVFIAQARTIHGLRYDYSKLVFKGKYHKVEIVCFKKGHGSFFQFVSNHIHQKQGCHKCFLDRKRLRAIDKFYKKARTRFGDRYDYSKIPKTYTRMIDPIQIRCIKHDYEFWVSCDNHIRQGTECHTCMLEQKAEKKRKEKREKW